MKNKILRYCGNLQQLVYARPITYNYGNAKNLDAILVKCGDISFTSAVDKALDITDFSYKGMNMTFLSKPGLQAKNYYDIYGAEAVRSIMGGLFFTCGLQNICAPCNVKGREYPMHGRIRSTQADHISTNVVYDNNNCSVIISGEMRESELFGENLVLKRTIESTLGENSIIITDEIENQTFREEPLMLMYHCNIGYPFLNENCKIYIPTKEVTGREDFSNKHKENWNIMESPIDNEQEYVFIHDINSNKSLDTMVMVVNHELEIGLTIEYNKKNLPYFMQWKSIASGDYVLGLEPSNSSVYGKLHHIENNNVHYLKPFEKEKNVLKFSVVEGKENIKNVIEQINKIYKGD